MNFFDPQYLNIQAMLRSLPYQGSIGNHEGSDSKFKNIFHTHIFLIFTGLLTTVLHTS